MTEEKQPVLSHESTRFGVNALLDEIKRRQQLKNDSALARFLGVHAPVISKLRHGMPLSPTIILRIHESTEMPVKAIRTIACQPEPPTP